MDNSIAYAALFLINVLVLTQSYFERRRLLGLIDQLTDKVMSRNYQDYVGGQILKEDEVEEPTHRVRTDKAEALIERQHLEATELEGIGKGLGNQLDDMVNVGT